MRRSGEHPDPRRVGLCPATPGGDVRPWRTRVVCGAPGVGLPGRPSLVPPHAAPRSFVLASLWRSTWTRRGAPRPDWDAIGQAACKEAPCTCVSLTNFPKAAQTTTTPTTSSLPSESIWTAASKRARLPDPRSSSHHASAGSRVRLGTPCSTDRPRCDDSPVPWHRWASMPDTTVDVRHDHLGGAPRTNGLGAGRGRGCPRARCASRDGNLPDCW